MQFPVLALLLVGAAYAEHNHAWRTENEYHYRLDSRTLTGLPEISNQYTGVLVRGSLKVQPKDEFTFHGKLSKIESAQIHIQLPDGWDSKIPEDVQDYKPLAMSGKPFEVKMKHGTVREITVDKNVPTWEVNLLKSVISQLQVDTRGENMINSVENQPPEDENGNAMFKTMEDSVGGKCEVHYDINVLAKSHAEEQLQDLSGAEWRTQGEIYEIMKTKDYDKCQQRMAVHYGIPGKNDFEPGSSKSGDFLAKSSISKVAISGNLKSFTIHSSETTEEVILRPNLHDSKSGIVASRINLWLSKVETPVSPWPIAANPESVGNLVYTYNRPFYREGEDRTPGVPTRSESSKENNDADPNFSSERKLYKNYNDDSNSHERFSDSNDSLDDSSKNSQIGNKYYQQPVPTLNEPPQYPILPFFIGNRGKSLTTFGDVDVATRAKTLASEIGRDAQNPKSIPHEQTLEKFTILVDILRTMNTDQMREIQRELYQPSTNANPNDEGQNVKRNTWTAFRDAIASVGSGPALVVITEWLRDKIIEGLEATEIISVLSKTAKEPTPEYINAVFKMATMSEVLSDELLAATAIMTFTELIRYAQINHKSAHNRYPVHTFGNFKPENEEVLFNDYLPYLLENFEKGMANNDHRAQLYIRAIGNTAHPKMMAVFEPYLEGKKPSTAYQRTMMVISMDKLMDQHPRTVRGVMYRIYQNTGESYKVRAVAAAMILATNPPLTMLQRMAQFTNSDPSKHVNSVVKSLIESATKLRREESKKLMMNARAVRHLLTPDNYATEYSAGHIVDNTLKDLNIEYTTIGAWLGSDDSVFPSAVYTKFDQSYGGFKTPRTENLFAVSSIQQLFATTKNLLRKFYGDSNDSFDKSGDDRTDADATARMLNLFPAKRNKLQGLYCSRDKYSNSLLSWDEDMLNNIPEELFKNTAKTLKSGTNFNVMSLQNFDITIGFPTETGLPFVYNLQIPRLRKLWGKIKATSDPDYSEKASAGKPQAMNVFGDVQVVYSRKLQSRFGFVTPFEHQRYMSGVDKNIQVHLPISGKIDYDSSQRKVRVKVQPNNNNEQYIPFHFSIVPFTARQDITDLKPTASENNPGKMVMKKNARESFTVMGEKTRGMAIKIKEVKSKESPNIFQQLKNLENIEERILFPMSRSKMEYYVLDTSVVPNFSSEQSVVVNVAWDSKANNKAAPALSLPDKLPSKIEAVEPSSKEPLSLSRRQEMMQEVLKGSGAARAAVVDATVEMPGQEPSVYIMTTAVAKNEYDGSWKTIVFLRDRTGASAGEPSEICGAAQTSATNLFPTSFNQMVERPLKKNIDIELKFGRSCSKGSKVEIHGQQWQSEEYRESSKSNSKRFTDNGTPEDLLDKSKVTIEINSEEHMEKCQRFLNHVLHFVTGVQKEEFTKISTEGNENKNLIEVNASVHPGINKASITLKAPHYEAVSKEIEMNKWTTLALSTHPQGTNRDKEDGYFSPNVCIIKENHVNTFDGAQLPLTMNKCWHVAMATVPELQFKGSQANIPTDKKASVMVREHDTDKRSRMVAVILANELIKLSKSGSQLKVEYNGKIIDLSESGYTSQGADKDDEIKITKLPGDGALTMQSKKYGLKVQYDGNRVNVEVDNKYRDSVRGLCGNYDSEPANDMLTPRNRISPKPEDFITLYTLKEPNCEDVAAEIREQEKSFPSNAPKLSNVVSNRDAGRAKNLKKTWAHPHDSSDSSPSKNKSSPNVMVKTRIVLGNGQTCFSLRPLPTCTPGAQPIRVRTAMFPVYCIPNGESSKRLSDRINKGANPDFSQKPPSMKVKLEIPGGCTLRA